MSQQQQQTTTRSESFINTASKLLEKVKQQQQQLMTVTSKDLVAFSKKHLVDANRVTLEFTVDAKKEAP